MRGSTTRLALNGALPVALSFVHSPIDPALSTWTSPQVLFDDDDDDIMYDGTYAADTDGVNLYWATGDPDLPFVIVPLTCSN